MLIEIRIGSRWVFAQREPGDTAIVGSSARVVLTSELRDPELEPWRGVLSWWTRPNSLISGRQMAELGRGYALAEAVVAGLVEGSRTSWAWQLTPAGVLAWIALWPCRAVPA